MTLLWNKVWHMAAQRRRETIPTGGRWVVSWRKWLGIKRWTDVDWWAGPSKLRSQHK